MLITMTMSLLRNTMDQYKVEGHSYSVIPVVFNQQCINNKSLERLVAVDKYMNE